VQASERRQLAQEAARLGSTLDDAQLDRLSLYVEILRTWNERVRILGDRDPLGLVQKHLPDCLALLPFLPDTGPLVDIGSGAGLPGMVLACVRTDLECWLIESRRKRVSFLQEAKARLSLDRLTVIDGRAEEVAGRPEFAAKGAVVTARAVSLEDLLKVGPPLMLPGGRLLAMRSRRETIAATEAMVRRHGFTILASHDYRLAGGEQRRLVVLRHA
jgi:16S rRNA (guanine527-N7)-methyltransferase